MVVAVFAAIRLDERRIATIDWALDRIGAILVIVTLVLIIPFQVTAFMNRAPIAQFQPAGTTTTAAKRDVYWFIFDRYGSERALQLQYGIDNDLPEWLEAHGFTVLKDSHANYIRTVLSIATTVQMQHLDTVATAQGARSEDITTANEWLQDPPIARQFKALGYRYHHIGSAFDPTRTDRGADVNYTVPSPPGTGDFEDGLFDTSAVPALLKRLHLPEPDRVRQYDFSTYALDAVAKLRDEPGPKFVMTHVLLPHPPVVFDVDGTFIEDARRPSSAGSRCTGASWRTRTRASRRSSRICRACPRTSDRSSSSRPTRGRGRLLWHGAPYGRLARRGLREGARTEIRDPQRLVRAGRRGSWSLSVDDRDQHVPDAVQPLLRARLRALARPDLFVERLVPPV